MEENGAGGEEIDDLTDVSGSSNDTTNELSPGNETVRFVVDFQENDDLNTNDANVIDSKESISAQLQTIIGSIFNLW